MEIFVLTLLLFTLSIAGLAIGLLFGRAPLAGSCGNVSCLKSVTCTVCRRRRLKEK